MGAGPAEAVVATLLEDVVVCPCEEAELDSVAGVDAAVVAEVRVDLEAGVIVASVVVGVEVVGEALFETMETSFEQ